MRVLMILPALTEARGPGWRPIKYFLFPPLGLATLAGYLDPDDEVALQDEHVETVDLGQTADLVVIQAVGRGSCTRGGGQTQAGRRPQDNHMCSSGDVHDERPTLAQRLSH
jgi:hypothetical protein